MKTKEKYYYQATCSCGWHSRKFLSPEPAGHYAMTHQMNAKDTGHNTDINEFQA
jgi:hypothetical protein